MASLVPPSVLAPIQTTFGAALIGSWIDIATYGFVTCQVYIYFSNQSHDMLWAKCMVFGLWLLSTVHAAVSCRILYHYLISNMFNLPVFNIIDWSLVASVIVHVITVAIVLIYFTFAVYKVATRRARPWITGILGCAVASHVGFGISVIVHLIRAKSIAEIPTFTRTAVLPMGISQVVADILIAASLCLFFNDKRDGFNKQTNNLLKTLTIYALNRCLLTSAVAMVDFLAVAVNSNNLWVIGCEFVINDLYIASLLASLNLRQTLRNQASTLASTNDSWPNSLRLGLSSDPNSGSAGHVRQFSKSQTRKYGGFQPKLDGDVKAIDSHQIQVRVDVDTTLNSNWLE